MEETDGLICAYRLDGKGGGEAVDWTGLQTLEQEGQPYWVHFDRSKPATRDWLAERAGLDPVIVEALLEVENRPRCETFEDGFLVILRGVNLNPGANPEDMIAIRIWIDGRRMISTRTRRLMAIQDTRERIEGGRGPRETGDLLVAVAGNLIQRMSGVVDDLEEKVDNLEEQVILAGGRDIRAELIEVRRETIGLRRYLAPQREALSRLMGEERPWLGGGHRLRLREIADRTARYIDDLDSVRERASIVQDELMSRLSEQMNRTMYVLTLVAALMLPLGFVTGLLGMNVGGMPGADYPYGFALVCLLMLALVACQVWLFRRMHWF